MEYSSKIWWLTHGCDERVVELVCEERVWQTAEEQLERTCHVMDSVHFWINNHTSGICECVIILLSMITGRAHIISHRLSKIFRGSLVHYTDLG